MHATCSLCTRTPQGVKKSAWLSIRGTLRTLPTPRPIRPRRDGRLGVTVLATLTAPTTPRLIGRSPTTDGVRCGRRETAGSACSRARRCRPVGSDVDNLDRPNARDPSATARREGVQIWTGPTRARRPTVRPPLVDSSSRRRSPAVYAVDRQAHGRGSDQFLEPESSEFALSHSLPQESCGWRIVYL